MPFDPDTVPHRLIDAAKHGNMVPLVGSGVSRQAGNVFPAWTDLLDGMTSYAVSKHFMIESEGEEVKELIARQELLMAAEALRSKINSPDEYVDFLDRAFNPPGVEPASVHKALIRLDPPLLLTTNYDHLLEDAYAEVHRRAPTVYTYKRADAIQKFLQSGRYSPSVKGPIIFKIHGTIEEPEELILTMRDYRQILYWEQGYRLVMSAIFLTQVVLMIGFSFADPELRVLLEFLRDALKKQNQPDFIFLSEGSIGPLQKERMRNDFGVEVITYKSTPEHPELLELINFLVEKKGENNG
jgi:hypothetical protein